MKLATVVVPRQNSSTCEIKDLQIGVWSQTYITAEVEIPQGGGEGVILAQGGRFAGWSLYMNGGKVSYVHNWVGRRGARAWMAAGGRPPNEKLMASGLRISRA